MSLGSKTLGTVAATIYYPIGDIVSIDIVSPSGLTEGLSEGSINSINVVNVTGTEADIIYANAEGLIDAINIVAITYGGDINDTQFTQWLRN